MPLSNDFLYFIFRSVGLADECLGQHDGAAQRANLGDGHDYSSVFAFCFLFLSFSLTDLVMCQTVNETSEIRYDYGDPQLGSCRETIEGGNHLRYWIQDGPQGNRYGFGLGLFYLSTEFNLICCLLLVALFLRLCHMRCP